MIKANYYIDFEKFTLIKFRTIIEQSELLPSRKIIQSNLIANFEKIAEQKISNLFDLQKSLKTKDKIYKFAKETGISENYLTILIREINSYQPTPVNFNDFPILSKVTIDKLQLANIKNTANLFDKVISKTNRVQISSDLDINSDEILELTKLTDLVRIKWIGPIFACMFLNTGVDTSQKVSISNSTDLYNMLLDINKNNRFTKAKFQESDVSLCINVAKEVPKIIEY